MHLELLRFSTTDERTLGTLHIDGKFECFTVEDTWRPNKVKAETRIHPGVFEVGVREEGGRFNPLYADRYDFHKGMLVVQDTPEFEHVYFHTGNHEGHTEGCILVNNNIFDGKGGGSRQAYQKFYPKVIDYALAGDLTLSIRDYA